MYLMINHTWRANFCKKFPYNSSFATHIFFGLITFFAVVVAWVFFRAADVNTAFSILLSMSGLQDSPITASPVEINTALFTAIALLSLTWIAPNTYQLTNYIGPEGIYGRGHQVQPSLLVKWRVSTIWATAVGVLLALDLANLLQISEFIYFQF